LVALAEAKRSVPTTDEILELVVAWYNSGKPANYYEQKPSRELRKNPLRFYGEYFHDGSEDSDRAGGKLKYFRRATPERAKAFLHRLGVEPAGR
jgi:hypothetical protein